MKKSILLIALATSTVDSMEKQVPASQPAVFSGLLSPVINNSTATQETASNPQAALVKLTPSQLHDAYKAWQPRPVKNFEQCSFCTITQDRQYLIIGDSYGRILIYLYNNLKLVCVCDTAKETFPLRLAISPDNKYILFNYYGDTNVYIYNISNWNNCFLHKKLVGHTSWVKFAQVTGNRVITWSIDGAIKLWNLKDTNSNPISSIEKILNIRRLLLSSNCNYVFSCASGKGTQLWDITDQENLKLKPVVTQECHTPVEIVKINDISYIVTRSGCTISLYSLEDGNPTALIASFEHPSGVIAHLFLPDLNYLITSTDKCIFYIWDIKELKKPQLLSVIEIDECERAITAFAMSGDKFLLAGTYEGSIYVWDIENINQPELLKKFKGHSSFTTQDPNCRIKQLKVLSNNKLLSYGQDGSIKIWQLPE